MTHATKEKERERGEERGDRPDLTRFDWEEKEEEEEEEEEEMV